MAGAAAEKDCELKSFTRAWIRLPLRMIPGTLPPAPQNLQSVGARLNAYGFGVIPLPDRRLTDSLRCAAWLTRGAGPAVLLDDPTGTRMFRQNTGKAIVCSYVLTAEDRLQPGDYTLWYHFGDEDVVQQMLHAPDSPANARSTSFKAAKDIDGLVLRDDVPVAVGQATVTVTLPRRVNPNVQRLGVMLYRDNDPAAQVPFRVTVFDDMSFRIELVTPATETLRLSWVVY